MPIIPVFIKGHKLWAFADSGATYSILSKVNKPGENEFKGYIKHNPYKLP